MNRCAKYCYSCRSDGPSVVHCRQTCAGVMDDEFDGQGGDALSAGSSEEEPAVGTVSEAKGISGGLNEGEHVSMRGELWSDEDESFEAAEAGTALIFPSICRALHSTNVVANMKIAPILWDGMESTPCLKCRDPRKL